MKKKEASKQPHRNMMVAHALFRKAGKHGKSNKQERAAARSHKETE